MMRIEYVDQSGLVVIQWSMEVGLTIGMLSTVPSSRDIGQCRAVQCIAVQFNAVQFNAEQGSGILWMGFGYAVAT